MEDTQNDNEDVAKLLPNRSENFDSIRSRLLEDITSLNSRGKGRATWNDQESVRSFNYVKSDWENFQDDELLRVGQSRARDVVREANLDVKQQKNIGSDKELLLGINNFDAIRSSLLAGFKSNVPDGAERAKQYAEESTGNFKNIQSDWEQLYDDDPFQIGHVGQSRAHEYARDTNVEISDLMQKWSNKHFSSLQIKPQRKEECLEFAPIQAFIAALASDHGSLPTDESVNSSDIEQIISASCQDNASELESEEDSLIAPNGHLRTCVCASSVFSSRSDELMEFFLPKLGMACSCGKDPKIPLNPEITDLTAIEFILRPWQCQFLKSFGINRGDQLVKANHRSAPSIAKAMKKWRRDNKMARARTVSCGLALHIWSKVSKIYVRSIRRQIAIGAEIVKPPSGAAMLSHILSQDERRISVPLSGRKPSTEKTSEDESRVEI